MNTWVMVSKTGRIVDGTNASTKEGSSYLAYQSYGTSGGLVQKNETLEYAKKIGYTFARVEVIPKGWDVTDCRESAPDERQE